MYWIKRQLKNIKLQHKFLICFFSVIVALTASIGYFSYRFSSRIILDKTVIQTQETIQQLSENIEHNIRLINEKLSYLAYNPQVQATLQEDYGNLSEREWNNVQRGMSRMMVLVYSSVTLEDIVIHSNTSDTFSIASTLQPEDYTHLDYIATAKEAHGKNVILNDPRDRDNVLIVKQINDLVRLQPLGTLRASLKKSVINDMIDQVDFASEGSIVVFDQDFRTVVGESDIFAGEDLKELFQWTGNFEYRGEDGDYVIVYQKSRYTDWTTVGIMPKAVLYKEIQPLKTTTITIAVAMLLLCTLISRLLARIIVTPLTDMVAALNDFSLGNFQIRLPEDRGDEIGVLRRGFNEMSANIETLIDDVYHAELLRRESEFKALQAQINPHFLYNTLDTINWMAHKSGMDVICRMVTAVGDLMRISISNSRRFVTLREELRFVEDYLYIQKIRYRDKINTTFQVDPDLLEQVIPKLILQPLVEDAVVHGIETSKSRGDIRLEGRREGAYVVFTVSDTGVGIPEDRLRTLLENPPAAGRKGETHTHLGIQAVHRRIQYLYGPSFGLAIQSQAGTGTAVTVRIPYYENPADAPHLTRHALDQL